MSDSSDTQAPPKVSTQWNERRPWLFKRCAETNESIWPFENAYVKVIVHSRPSPKEHGAVDEMWMSSKAYTFRKLKGTL